MQAKMPAGALQANNDVRAVRKSPGVIIGEFRPDELRLGEKPPIWTAARMKEQYQKVKTFMTSTYVVATMKRWDVPFKANEFAPEAQANVIEVFDAISRDDKETLRSSLTLDFYGNVRGQSNKRRSWKFHGQEDAPKTVYIVATQDPNNKEFMCVQVTVRIHIKVQRDGGEVQSVVSFPVFERAISRGGDLGQWQICGFREEAKFGAFTTNA